jgi:hypothetical protein
MESATAMNLEPAPTGLLPLPREAEMLLARLGAPARLVAHLTLVHSSAATLVGRLSKAWPCLAVDRASVLLGAAVHDVGKVVHPEELKRSGKAHETAGEALLLREGFGPSVARLARTHGRHDAEGDLAIEDLLVILADAVWKGARRPAVEERLCREIARACHEETWRVYATLDEILAALTAGAEERLAWHAAHSA